MQLPQTVVLDVAQEVNFLLERLNLLPQSALITVEQVLKWCVECNGDKRMPALPALVSKINNALHMVDENSRLVIDEAAIIIANKIYIIYTKHNLWTMNGISNYSFLSLMAGGDIQVGLGINYGTEIHNPDIGAGAMDQGSGLSF